MLSLCSCCKYRSCCVFFIRKSTAFPGDIPTCIGGVVTSVLELGDGWSLTEAVGFTAFTIATAASAIASHNDSFLYYLGVFHVIVETSGGSL